MYTFTENLFEVHKDLFFELIIEQNEEVFYCTVWNSIVSKCFETRLNEHENEFDYLIDSKRICIRLAKERLIEQDEIYDDKQKNRRKQLIASVHEEKDALQPAYDFLHENDLILCTEQKKSDLIMMH